MYAVSRKISKKGKSEHRPSEECPPPRF
jgi:hypothetical protein